LTRRSACFQLQRLPGKGIVAPIIIAAFESRAYNDFCP